MVGSDVLVAPVVKEGATNGEIYLPADPDGSIGGRAKNIRAAN